MHQDFHIVSAAIGKEIGAVRLRRTEFGDHSGQRGLGCGVRIHGFGDKSDGVDTDHWASSRIKREHASGSEDGHFTVSFCGPSGTSMLTDIR